MRTLHISTFPFAPPHIESSAKPGNMARIQAVLLLSCLLAVSTASARILQQETNETAPATTGFASELGSAIEGAKTTANVSMFIYAWEEGGEGSTQIALRSSCCCSACMHARAFAILLCIHGPFPPAVPMQGIGTALQRLFMHCAHSRGDSPCLKSVTAAAHAIALLLCTDLLHQQCSRE